MRVRLGETYGMLTVIGKQKWKRKHRRTLWILRCECGAETTASADKLHRGRKKSCGCFKDRWLLHPDPEMQAQMVHTNRSYRGMIDRCYNPRQHKFAAYGGKGITVCEKWKNSFDAFLADMGHRPRGTTIDRIDTLGNYEPRNCRWATIREQNDNKRNTMWVEHGGHRAKLVEVCRALNLDANVVRCRLRYGWDLRRALTEPTRPKKPNPPK